MTYELLMLLSGEFFAVAKRFRERGFIQDATDAAVFGSIYLARAAQVASK